MKPDLEAKVVVTIGAREVTFVLGPYGIEFSDNAPRDTLDNDAYLRMIELASNLLMTVDRSAGPIKAWVGAPYPTILHNSLKREAA